MSLPHKKKVLSVGIVSLLGVVVIEATSFRHVLHETGSIHLIAAVFACAAFVFAWRGRFTTDGGITTFSRSAAISAIAVGFAHVVEYFGDTKGYFDEFMVSAVLSSAYLISGLLIAEGARQLLLRIGARTSLIFQGISVIAFMQIAAIGLVLIGRLSGESAESVFLLLLLGAGALCAVVLEDLSRRMPLVKQFILHLIIAGGLVIASYAMEYFMNDLMRYGMDEARVENILHYLFYVGLTLLLLSFDLLQHFKGVYADLQGELKG